MLVQFFQRLQQTGKLQSFFVTGEMTVLVAIVVAIWVLRPKRPDSNFRVREADRPAPPNPADLKKKSELANAKIERKSPLLLEGIRLDGPPHLILGVPRSATQDEIQQAYRNLMKRYHPDKVGPPGSQAWKDAQKIAEVINQAKSEMLNQLKRA
jgi:hypothetical protein